ncbi:DNA replication regulator SLD3-domain-containing protein [Annulohypoxylon bovei var. microspora]|nr:DNA replication regulator SLD3-domain-containing protein [Annulohypoxylon bovei var. microspora]
MPSRAASVASRRSSGATLPMPSAKAPLNSSQNNAYVSSSQKSNSAAETLEDLLKPSIVVKPHPTKLSIQPRSLQPLMLLPREHLQLSYLDLSSPYGNFEYSRSFESNVKILDLEGRFGSRPVVLIARLESDKSIYALERQKGGLYTICHIGSWVDLQDLEKAATVSLPQLLEKKTSTSKDPHTLPPLTTPQLHHDTKKRRLAIEALESIVKKPVRPRSASTTSQLIPPTGPPTPDQTGAESQVESARILRDELPTGVLETQGESQVAKASEIDDSLSAPTAGAIFENIRNQYFDSLYHSMGSLGYFAKGPLSRARAAFHLDCDSNLEMNDLVGFLKSLAMTTAQIDKKYRETIPDIISKMKPMFQDSDDEQANAKTKKRKAKKMKLGKDGLYPMENDRIKKWWDSRKPQFKDDEDMTTNEPHETKLQVAWLRSRETQLQMIIILEILALEPSVTSRNDEDSQLPGLPGLDEPAPEVSKSTSSKKRSGRNNLPVLVDIHADRLCIWQSTALDGVKFLSAGRESQEPNTQKSLDPLKDFCVDIIVPFFSARLPEKCDSISRKLGGPLMMPPPPKPKAKKLEPIVKSKPKPGSVAKRPVVSKSSKSSGTLEKVLSRESEKHRRSMSRGPSGVIALMRSASTPMLKRETSEPLSLKNIPRADSATSREKAPRPLTAAPPKRRSDEEKAKKEALVQAELHDAISTLRRPNREVVGKDIAEAAERRANTSLSQLKKAKKPTQYTRPHDSIVKATPVGKRYKDVFGMGAGNRATPRGMGSYEPSSAPSSLLIPSSGPRKRTHESAFALDNSPSIPRSGPFARQIDATPMKQSSLKQSFLSIPKADDEDILASSPIMARKSSSISFQDSGIGLDELFETPVKPRAVPIPQEGLVAATPAKRRILESTTANASTDRGTTEPGRKLSIFERLGWDDDLDELG